MGGLPVAVCRLFAARVRLVSSVVLATIPSGTMHVALMLPSLLGHVSTCIAAQTSRIGSLISSPHPEWGSCFLCTPSTPLPFLPSLPPTAQHSTSHSTQHSTAVSTSHSTQHSTAVSMQHSTAQFSLHRGLARSGGQFPSTLNLNFQSLKLNF